ncbi:MAG: peptidylprolyl isomerase [Cyanobacteria bacterium CRU_2_1]|nr:peptidylprolyl isomerase [Cyanobacteria bacterium RU_5_0]NJR62461.1 peptidylprolyl isomerase [Cyanobacteria bacterium CRU_2_1]
MPLVISISTQDILQQAKLTAQLSSLIEGAVTRKIIHHAATEANTKIDATELQQAADQFRLLNQLESIEDTLTWLEQQHLSLDEFEEMIHTNLLCHKLAQLLFGNQIESWFVAHQIDYRSAALYEVILDNDDLAMELFYALQEEEIGFSEVARRYIQDIELCRRGGYRGVVHRHDMKSEIAAKVFAAKPPQLLKPIMTAQGIHLILVEEIIQPALDEQLRNQILSTLFKDWLKQQTQQSQISTVLSISPFQS